jgi:hypothetical protein
MPRDEAASFRRWLAAVGFVAQLLFLCFDVNIFHGDRKI